MKNKGPKILVVDVETAPLIAHVWALWDQNVGLNQIQQDWHLLSYSAKWLDDPPSEIIYADQRKAKDITNDKKLLEGLWKLLDEADIVITQNGKAFDHKKINARFLANGMQPPSTYRHIDTALIARKHFAFTSNKLEYMTDKFNVKYKKQKHKKFPGHDMWVECLAGNQAAWKEMEKYNKYDVLALEELFYKLYPWDNSINFGVYYDGDKQVVCGCGSCEFIRNGYSYTNSGKYERYRCRDCGAETKAKENKLSKNKRKSLRVPTSRS